jgi:hypothetical protein
MTDVDPLDRHLRKEEIALFAAGAATSLAGIVLSMGGLL